MRRPASSPPRNCEHPAEPRFGQARKPRSGRSEAEWLDRIADRWTISRRDGRRARDRAVRQRTRNAIDARWWKRRRRRRSSAAAVRIQSVCALNLQNARFRRNLTADVNTTRRRDHAALRSAHDRADTLRSRSNETGKWGVSDPRWTCPGAKKGAGDPGSLTSHLHRQWRRHLHRNGSEWNRAPPDCLCPTSALRAICGTPWSKHAIRSPVRNPSR